MEQQITTMIGHMAKAHSEMARMIGANRHIAVHMAHLINALPNEYLADRDGRTMVSKTVQMSENLTAYVNNLASLEEAIADHLKFVVKQLGGDAAEEE